MLTMIVLGTCNMEQTEKRFKIYMPRYYQMYGWAGDAIIFYFGFLMKFNISMRSLRPLVKFPIHFTNLNKI